MTDTKVKANEGPSGQRLRLTTVDGVLARRPSIVGDAEAARHEREMQIEALQFMAEKASEPHVPNYETGGDDAG